MQHSFTEKVKNRYGESCTIKRYNFEVVDDDGY